MTGKYFVTHTCKSCCYEGIGEQKEGIEYEELSHQDIADLLNSQAERIKELQQTIDTIAKDYEEYHGMDIRNAEWFTAW